MRTLRDIRATFLNYFKNHGHEVVTSSPLVPQNDPTLLFTNAGMVPFKDYFTGQETPPYTRATSSQKCLRAGGKHNDLENVGYTARHHTFFEMLGNFSFGDYFKEEAIHHAWHLVTKEFGLPQDRLLVTIFHDDDEAAGYWQKIAGLSDDRIIRINSKDNFWSMGDTGPCGPCSEIFYDHGPDVPGGPPGSADEDGDRFIEIWNLVFMQYEQLASGERISLPKPCIDTGMGLERIAAVLQGVHNNFEVDLFAHLIDESMALTGNKDMVQSHRVIADHLRASSFLLADGVLPSNEGRGYVLRRIMRRAMRHAHLIGAKDPLMYRLVPALIQAMADAFPELNRAREIIEKNLQQEEEKFRQTLSRGLKILDESLSTLAEGASIPGDVAFRLYDTYGFPVDLTADIARQQGRTLDMSGFEAAMSAQKAAARASWAGSGDEKTAQIWSTLVNELPATEFLGYTDLSATSDILALLDADKNRVPSLNAGEKGYVITRATPFYGESGGQVGDTGALTTDQAKAEVTDTQKPLGKLHAHAVTVASGALHAGDTVDLTVNATRRAAVVANHSATHLLHAALRRVLGGHVLQKGSLVEPDRLRFDFAHTGALTEAEITAVEDEVNRAIWQNYPTTTQHMSMDDAVAAGAIALFGEKYEADVRVVTMGGADVSMELCGGTHVARTGDIGLFKIVSEAGVASGVRRIEAVTRAGAFAYLRDIEGTLTTLSDKLKVRPATVVDKVDQVLQHNKALEKEIVNIKKQALSSNNSLSVEELPGGVAFVSQTYADVPAQELKGLVDQLKDRHRNAVIALISTVNDKVSGVIGVSGDVGLSAVDLIREFTPLVGGKGGGGRPDLAQGGGTDASQISQALTQLKDHVSQHLS